MIPINEGYNYKSKSLVETAIQDGAYENNKNFQSIIQRNSTINQDNNECQMQKEYYLYLKDKAIESKKSIYNNGRVAGFMARDGWIKTVFFLYKENAWRLLLLLYLKCDK